MKSEITSSRMKRLLLRLVVIGMVISCFASVAACGKASSPKVPVSAPVSSQTVDFSASVPQDESADAVFSVTVSDFISCFNAVYRADHGEDYLLPLKDDHWVRLSEPSLCFGYDAVCFQFAADRKVWPMPRVSVYAPKDGSEIYELRMTFDHHGNQQILFDQFRALCLCAEKMMIPKLSDTEVEDLFDTLYAQSEYNFFGDHYLYGDPERPTLDAVIRNGNVGFYCFYGAGNVEICIIPLTPSAVQTLQDAGTAIQDMQDLQDR